jgi:hypothetical protein
MFDPRSCSFSAATTTGSPATPLKIPNSLSRIGRLGGDDVAELGQAVLLVSLARRPNGFDVSDLPHFNLRDAARLPRPPPC